MAFAGRYPAGFVPDATLLLPRYVAPLYILLMRFIYSQFLGKTRQMSQPATHAYAEKNNPTAIPGQPEK
jgi:hypothetical protein